MAAAKHEAAWEIPSASLRDSVVLRSAPSCVSRRSDSAISHTIFVIADVHGPGHYYLGDEAMLEPNLAALRRLAPKIHFTLLSGDPTWSEKRYGAGALSLPPVSSNKATIRLEQPSSVKNRVSLLEQTVGPAICEAIRGSDWLIISGGGNLCSTWREKVLERAGRELASLLCSELIQLSRWEPSAARWLIQQSSLVVSTRYHPIVFATACAFPSLAIYSDEYTHIKLRGTLRPSDLQCRCMSVAEAEQGALFRG